MTVTPRDCSVGKLFGSTDIVAASVSVGRKLLMQDDAFIRSQSLFDRQSRVNLPLDTITVSKEVYLAYVAAQVMDWADSEVEALKRILISLSPKFSCIQAKLPDVVYLVKTTGKEEGYAAYTRKDDVIVVPANMTASLSASTNFGDPLHPSSQDAYLEGIITHEVFHLISKNNSALRRRLYHLINYKIIDNEIELPRVPWGGSPKLTMPDLKITNPDGPTLDVAIEMQLPKGLQSELTRTPLVPVLLSSQPYSGGSFFDSLEWWFIAICQDAGGKWVPVVGENQQPIMVRADSVIEQYRDLVGRNFTHEIFHPDEILAQTFVLVVNQPSIGLINDISRSLKQGP
jgi:hypothetical protein